MSHSSITAKTASDQGLPAVLRDFWLLYPSATTKAGVSKALHALYYLPANYKLIVLSDVLSRDTMSMPEDSISSRVRIENTSGSPNQASPFSYANAVIYDDTEPEGSDRPAVILSGHSPEALATAVLRIARAA